MSTKTIYRTPTSKLPTANGQPSPADHGSHLPVMESFYSLQGEGFHTGRSAYFIRLGGCDVGCHWCDVKESWDVSAHPQVDTQILIQNAEAVDPAMVVVTGGEPLMHDLTDLTDSLQENGLKTHLETSGTHPLSGKWDWICFSPKKFKPPLPEIYHKAHELKIVVYNSSDLAWAEAHASRINKNCKLFLQPEWSKVDQMLPLIQEYIKNNSQWRISLQTHKYLNLP